LCEVGRETMAIFGIEPGVEASSLHIPTATATFLLMDSNVCGRLDVHRPLPEVLYPRYQGLQTSTQVAFTPLEVSVIFPVGSSLPVFKSLHTISMR
jgi:hypothetical protein